MWPNWQNMLSAAGWGLLALVPPAIIALYFLKLKRKPLEVPSTYLWRRSIEDLHVNSLWQKLRRNLLLWLQLAMLGLAALALLRPSWQGTDLVGNRFVFLIDNSASMSATDVEPSRLDEAKRQAAALVEEMAGDDVGMIISFNEKARVLQGFTGSRKELLRALDAIKPSRSGTSLEQALHLAAGLANPNRSASDPGDVAVADPLPATLYIFSDGRFADVQDFALENLDPRFVPVGREDAVNVGILSFAARKNEEKLDELQAFARLANYGPEPVTVRVKLLLDGGTDPGGDQLLDAQEVTLEPGRSGGAPFPLPEDLIALDDPELRRLELRLEAEDGRLVPSGAPDDLAADNVAWTTVDPGRLATVLYVTADSSFLGPPLTTTSARLIADVSIQPPSFLETPQYRAEARQGVYDLVIYDRCAPEPQGGGEEDGADLMPQANTLFIGALPPSEAWSAGEPIQGPQILDTERAHPLTQWIDLGNVLVAEGRPLQPPPASQVLVTSSAGPLMAIASRGIYQDAVLGFSLVGPEGPNTDWPTKRSFPVFALSVLQYLGGNRELGGEGGVRAGETVSLPAQGAAEELTVRTPSDRTFTVRRSTLGTFTFTDTEETGIYEVLQGDQLADQFAVNVFGAAQSYQRAESNLALRPKDERDKMFIKIGYTEVEGEEVLEAARREGWKLLVLLALAVLLFEWYIYNRRVYI